VPGTYTLLIDFAEYAAIEFGAAGTHDLDPGPYAYTGSALGPGGFSRVDRHRELAAGERDARHWHVDYLLGHPAASIGEVVRTHGEDAECAISAAIDGTIVGELGASDCSCRSHLRYGEDRYALTASVRAAHEHARSDP